MNVKTVLFQVIRFSIKTVSTWPIYRTPTDATTPGHSGPESDDNKRVLDILQSSKTGTSLSDCLVSYPGHLFSYASSKMLSVYSTAPTDWVTEHSFGDGLTSLQRCSRCILQPQPTEMSYPGHLLREILPLCRDAVCILQPQPTETSYPGHLLREILPLYRDAVGVFYSPSRLRHHIQDTCCGSLTPCRDAVGVFYSPSRLGKLLLGSNKFNI